MSWITLKITNTQWEAELLQQMLAAHDIPARVIHQSMSSCFGSGTPAELQVLAPDRWTALLLISPVDDQPSDISQPAD